MTQHRAKDPQGGRGRNKAPKSRIPVELAKEIAYARESITKDVHELLKRSSPWELHATVGALVLDGPDGLEPGQKEAVMALMEFFWDLGMSLYILGVLEDMAKDMTKAQQG